jgi:hypothetical protein
MGVEAYVTLYDEERVREEYQRLWGDLGYRLEEDWTYPSWGDDGDDHQRIRLRVAGKWYLADYRDTEGHHDGAGNPFWFASLPYVDDLGGDPAVAEQQWREVDDRLGDGVPWECCSRNRNRELFGPCPAQARVLAALAEAGEVACTEVWT